MELLDGPGTLEKWLLPRLGSAHVIGIRTGWLSASGVAKVHSHLVRVLEHGGEVTIVANMAADLTDGEAARSLFELSADFPGRATVCLVGEELFQHGKAYYVRSRQGHAAAYVGSANLTGPGLGPGGNHETGVTFSDGEPVIQEILDSILAWRDHPAVGSGTIHGALPMGEILPGTLNEIELVGTSGGAVTGVPTGFADLDALTNGLHPGQLIVVAGRPGLGKSVLVLDFARAAAVKGGLPTAIFSLEMSRNEIMMRLLSAEARVPLLSMRTGTMSDDEWIRLSQRMAQIADAPLFIDDWPQMSVARIRSECRRLVERHGLRLVIVDYLQLMMRSRGAENREIAVAEMSRSLKLLAKELKVPVVAVSQLNRGPEQRVDKRPLLSDLRESGALEHDADVVVLVFREDAYYQDTPRAGEADLIVAKHRNGPAATITVAFQGHYSRFLDMADFEPHRTKPAPATLEESAP